MGPVPAFFVSFFVIFALDYAVFGRISNIVDAVRSKTEDVAERPYRPTAWWRLIGSSCGALLIVLTFFVSDAAGDALKAVMVCIVLAMLVITYQDGA